MVASRRAFAALWESLGFLPERALVESIKVYPFFNRVTILYYKKHLKKKKIGMRISLGKLFCFQFCSIWYIMSLVFLHCFQCIQSKSVNTTGGRGRDSTKWGRAVGWRGWGRRTAAGSHLPHSHGPGGGRSVQGLINIQLIKVHVLLNQTSSMAGLNMFYMNLPIHTTFIRPKWYFYCFTCWLP